ncbi:MAG: hypothetical protein AABX11_00835 [Nanoarchaeota archaeon]
MAIETRNQAVTYSPGMWTFDFGNRTGSLLQALLHPMTQEESAKQTFYDGFHSASLPELFSIWSKMFELRNADDKKVKNAVESARQFTQTSIRNAYPNTQTRIAYQPAPSSADKIIHGYGTSSHIIKEVGFVGRDGAIQEVLSLEQSLALTGKTLQEAEEIISYLNDTSLAYTWRVNQQPTRVDERVVWLGADSSRFDLYCSRDTQDARTSFGVKWAEKLRELQINSRGIQEPEFLMNSGDKK